MKKQLRNYFRLLRPRQWIKNLAIFAALTFGGELFNIELFTDVFYGFLIFCGISSAIYVINDIFDIEKDKLHPFKRFRPLANGDIPIRNALVIAILLASASIIASVLLSPVFFAIAIVY